MWLQAKVKRLIHYPPRTHTHTHSQSQCFIAEMANIWHCNMMLLSIKVLGCIHSSSGKHMVHGPHFGHTSFIDTCPASWTIALMKTAYSWTQSPTLVRSEPPLLRSYYLGNSLCTLLTVVSVLPNPAAIQLPQNTERSTLIINWLVYKLRFLIN